MLNETMFILVTDEDDEKRLINATRIIQVYKDSEEEVSTLDDLDGNEWTIKETPEQVYLLIEKEMRRA